MIPIWIGKMVAKGIIKGVKHRIDLKKIDKYVNKPNELDIQIKHLQRTVSKQGKYIESLEKDVAILKKVSHPVRDFVRCKECEERITESSKLMQATGDETI